ncbi:TetR/AcrR family transcriptional regulator [Patulibacter defluvii]|uniref:TetR/AcrR family transcriptional regulator n=1 Tax=Patulibacter defluvii TaxID=3095358 RepID=UPI002A7607DB|nr:TetR/AcrR family transcriptional regulator [Patulibacter sp. DM4]
MSGPDATGSVDGFKRGRVPRELRERQLLDLAERQFIERGYVGVSIEDVARAAGVSRPIVYEHFGSKDAMYLRCIERVRREFDEAIVEAARSAADLRQAIRQGGDAFFAIVAREPARWSLVYGGPPLVGEIADELAALRARTVGAIADALAEQAAGVDGARLVPVAHLISGAGEQLARWWLRTPDVPREAVVGLFCDFCAHGVGALSPASPA